MVEKQTIAVTALILGIGIVVTGSFSGLSSPEYDIEGDSLTQISSDTFTANTVNPPRGAYSEVSGVLIGEEERSALDEYSTDALNSKDILYEENGVTRFNGSEWAGTCTVTAGFEANDQTIEFEIDGELTSDTRLGCRADSTSVEDAKLTNCKVQPYDGLSQDEACRSAASSYADGEYLEVEYNVEEPEEQEKVVDQPVEEPVYEEPTDDPYSSPAPEEPTYEEPTDSEPVEQPEDPDRKSIVSLIIDILVFWN